MDFQTSDSDIRNIEKITQLVRKADYAKALRLTQKLKIKHRTKAIYQSLEVSNNVRSGITFIRSPSISSSELSFRVIIQAILSFRSSIALMSDSISRFLVSMTINIFCIKFKTPLKLPVYWYVYNQDFRDILIKNQNSINIGDTKKYYEEAQNLPKIFPKEAYAHIKALALWGDWGHHLSESEEIAYKSFAVEEYKALEKSHKFDNWRVKDIFENELYYHSGRFLDQYNLGKRTKKLRPSLGDFSMGVGASELAHQYQSKGKVQTAKKWARISIQHWQNHYTFRESKLEGDYFYIQALFISGKRTQAKKLALNVIAHSTDFENAAWASLFKRWGAY